jgi:hypothetical protein
MGKRFIGKVIHDVVGEVVPFVHVVNRNDVRMFQRRESRASRRNRTVAVPPASWGARTLTATGHSRRVSRARNTVPMPPWPSTRST